MKEEMGILQRRYSYKHQSKKQQNDTIYIRKECEMKHNPFVPREQRTAILTFDNGQRVRAEISIPGTDKPVWHTELERRIVNVLTRRSHVLYTS